MSSQKIRKIGVDVGRTIINRELTGVPPMWRNHLETELFPGAVDGCKKLNEQFLGQLELVSVAKLNHDFGLKTQECLRKHDFERLTGINLVNSLKLFCNRDAKIQYCIQSGFTHLVDDRLETVLQVSGYISQVFLFCPNGNFAALQSQKLPENVRILRSWSEGLHLLTTPTTTFRPF